MPCRRIWWGWFSLTVLHLDWESRGTADLRETGVFVYAQHKDTDLWLCGWAFGEEEPELWHPGEPVPQRIVEHVQSGGDIRAHNASFEFVMWRAIATPRHGWPEAQLEQFWCSAAEAAAMALPRSLEQLTQVTQVRAQKDEVGHRLMLQMCRPRRIEADGTIVWWTDPAKIKRLGEYCLADVRAEQAVEKVLRRLTAKEREIYLMDQRINDRGIHVDRPLVLAAKDVADEGLRRANAALCDLTAGAVSEVTQHDRLRQWLNGHGVETDSVDKAAVREMLATELEPVVRSVLELRADAGRSSLAKLDTLLTCTCDDDQARGLLLYHAASTGRWGGRLFQPHNLPKGEVENIEDFIPDVLARQYDSIDLVVHPLTAIMSLIRSMLTARPGCVLTAADLSGIEARVLNWFAGQDDVLARWRAYDAGDKSQDPYIVNAMRLYRLPFEEIKKFPHRQTGKFQELGCGFGMGWKTGVVQAKNTYQLTLTDAQTKEAVDSYRATHPKVVDFWRETDDAAMEAVATPGAVITFGHLRNLKFTKQGSYLYLILPSRRPLCYAAPKIVDRQTPWGEMRPAVEISAVGKNRQWERQGMYGGLWVENIVQAAARDIMAEGMLRVEAAGYPVVLDVHDEVISEVPEGFGSLEEFQSLLAAPPEWAAGCPIATEGWRGFRYRK